MSNLSIRTRLIILVLLFAAIAVTISALGVAGLSSVRGAFNEVNTVHSPARLMAMQISRDFEAINGMQNALVHTTDPEEIAEIVRGQDELYGEVEKRVGELRTLLGQKQDSVAVLEAFRAHVEDFRRVDAMLRKKILSAEGDQAINAYLGDHARLMERLGADLRKASDALAKTKPATARAVDQLHVDLLEVEQLLGRQVLDVGDASMAEREKALLPELGQLGQDLSALEESGPEGQHLAAQLRSALDEYRKDEASIDKLTLVNNRAHAAQLGAKGDQLAKAARERINELVHKVEGDVNDKAREVDSINNQSRSLLIIFSVVGILVAFFMAFLTVSQVTQGVEAVRRVAREVTDSSEQLKQATQSISQRASEEASSLEETSSTMEQMTATVEQNRQGASRAKELTDQSGDAARLVAEVTTQAAEAMQALKQAGGKIVEISGTVSEIAFQTNILALNASVEAARAGEHGRGFTVVASEVRTLAQRSAVSAKEISALIQESLQRIERSTELVSDSSLQMGKLVQNSRDTTTLVANINAAAQEQATGIGQVTQAVSELNQVVQANSAQAEELAASSENLSTLARELLGAVSLISGVKEELRTDAGGDPGPDHPSRPGPGRRPRNVHTGAPAATEPIHSAPKPQEFTNF